MRITSTEAIAALTQCLQKLGRDMDRHANPDWDEHENVFLAVNTIDALAAERDALRIRAEQAERRERALLDSNDEARRFLRERDALRAEVERLRAFITEFAAADFAAEPLPPKRHPEDEVDPVTDAAQVWAWQDDARGVLKGGANG